MSLIPVRMPIPSKSYADPAERVGSDCVHRPIIDKLPPRLGQSEMIENTDCVRRHSLLVKNFWSRRLLRCRGAHSHAMRSYGGYVDIKDDVEADGAAPRASNWRPLQIAFGVCGMFPAQLPYHHLLSCTLPWPHLGATRKHPPSTRFSNGIWVVLTSCFYRFGTQAVLLSSSG
jgi:hypothetical protein